MTTQSADLATAGRSVAIPTARARSRALSRRVVTTLCYVALIAWTLFNIMPFIWTLSTSFKQVRDAFSIPPVIFFEPTLEAYRTLWFEGRFADYLKSSIIVTTGTVAISLTIGCLAGYGLARYSGWVGFALLAIALIFRSLPRISFLLPAFAFSRATGLYDTHILLILVLVAINQPFTIWMLRSFFADIPVEIEEAAMVDGCSRFEAFVKVIMPLMLPGVITTGIFSLLLAYNEYLIPAILAASNAATLPVGIATIGTEDLKYWNVAAAGSVSIALPIILIVLFAQRYIIRGLTFGAVKG
jgi:multiple sugar transport system permease protein